MSHQIFKCVTCHSSLCRALSIDLAVREIEEYSILWKRILWILFQRILYSLHSLKSCCLEISIVQNEMKHDCVLVLFVFDFSWSRFFFVYLEEEIKGCSGTVCHAEGRAFSLDGLWCILNESVALLQPCSLLLIIIGCIYA